MIGVVGQIIIKERQELDETVRVSGDCVLLPQEYLKDFMVVGIFIYFCNGHCGILEYFWRFSSILSL